MTLVSRFAWITCGRFLAALLQAVSLILVARYAGPTDFGLLSAFLGIIIVYQAIFDFGISTYITKVRAQRPLDSVVPWALHLYYYAGFGLFVASSATGVFLAGMSGQLWWSYVPLAIAGCLERLSDIRLNVAMADGDVWKNATNLVTRRGISVILLMGATWGGVEATLSFGLASLCASVVSYVFSRKLVKITKPTHKFSWKCGVDILSKSSPFWANTLGSQIRNLDILVVGYMSSTIIAGYYGAVSRAVGPLRMVSSSLAAVLLPMAARQSDNQKSFVVPVAVVMGSLSFVYAALAYIAEDAVVLLLGSEYKPAASAFTIVLFGLIFASLASVLTSFLQAGGSEKVVGRVSIATSVIALSGVAWGAAQNGVNGAAYGLFASYLMQCFVLLAIHIRVHKSVGVSRP